MKKNAIQKAYNKLMIGFGIGILIILGVIGFYIYKFNNNPISPAPADWGNFGNLFGGILNPIISLCTLILLGFASYYVAKDSSNDSYERDMKLRRMDAYIELTQHDSSISRLVLTLTDILTLATQISNGKNKSGERYKQIEYEIKRLDKPTQQVVEYTLYLEQFEIQYKHLFKYGFDSEEYLALKKGVDSISDFARSTRTNLYSIDGRNEKVIVFLIKLSKETELFIANIPTTYASPLDTLLTALGEELK